ncbi:aspartate ammonia-lyase, partial [Lysinibacillus agricola]
MSPQSIEKDFLGERVLPSTAYYGIQTLRATENFPTTGYTIHSSLIKAMGIVQKVTAL